MLPLHNRVEIGGQQIGCDLRHRFHTEKFDLEKKSIQFPEARQRFAKLIIYNYDDPALHLNRIEVRGVDKELVLQYQANWNVRLLYGNPMITPPRYDIDRIKSYLNLDNLPKAALAAEAANPEYRLRRRAGPWTEVHPVMYWGGVDPVGSISRSIYNKITFQDEN
ncbi:MAG TPA: hypothetical protein VMW38_27075 [Terriglobia bacterium]|nr:hypothetical protein [Terriglobia bacterium]